MLCFDPKSLHPVFFQHIPSLGGMLQLWVKAVSCLIFSLLFCFGFGLFVLVFCLFPEEAVYYLCNPSPQQIPTNHAGIQESPRQWDLAFPEA